MSKKLIAFFSAEGTTKAKAQLLKEATGADIYEIKPETPYSAEDVNWRKPFSRCNKEWLKKAKLPLADTNANIKDYDTIYLAFPIWYFTAPLIIRSFFDSYDFSGKKIVVFATSGGSDFKKAVDFIKDYAKGAEVTEGIMLNGINSAEELKDFA
jgi:flavodoxin